MERTSNLGGGGADIGGGDADIGGGGLLTIFSGLS